MVECGANEVPEAEILDALDIAHSAIKKLCAAQRELAEKAGKPKHRGRGPEGQRGPDEARSRTRTAPRSTRRPPSRTSWIARPRRRRSRKRSWRSTPGRPTRPSTASTAQAAQLAFDALEKHIIRQRIAVHKKRPDGRSEREIREITIDVKPLPRTHGSALFTRGQTQALSVVALGTTREEMRLDNLGLETSKRYFHHYNFPPFSRGRGRLHARPEAPRHRPRRARRARAGPDDPGPGEVPVHDPRRVGHPRVQRLVLDGVDLRLLPVASWTPACRSSGRSPASPWA